MPVGRAMRRTGILFCFASDVDDFRDTFGQKRRMRAGLDRQAEESPDDSDRCLIAARQHLRAETPPFVVAKHEETEAVQRRYDRQIRMPIAHLTQKSCCFPPVGSADMQPRFEYVGKRRIRLPRSQCEQHIVEIGMRSNAHADREHG